MRHLPVTAPRSHRGRITAPVASRNERGRGGSIVAEVDRAADGRLHRLAAALQDLAGRDAGAGADDLDLRAARLAVEALALAVDLGRRRIVVTSRCRGHGSAPPGSEARSQLREGRQYP